MPRKDRVLATASQTPSTEPEEPLRPILSRSSGTARERWMAITFKHRAKLFEMESRMRLEWMTVKRRKCSLPMSKSKPKSTPSASELQALYQEHEPWALEQAKWYEGNLTPKQVDGLFPGQMDQAARVALWKTLLKWKPKRSSFRWYAHGRLLGALKDELSRCGSHDWRSQRPIQGMAMDAMLAEPARCETEESEAFAAIVDKCSSAQGKRILAMMFQEDIPQAEIARQLGVSPALIHKYKKAALAEIKEALCGS